MTRDPAVFLAAQVASENNREVVKKEKEKKVANAQCSAPQEPRLIGRCNYADFTPGARLIGRCNYADFTPLSQILAHPPNKK